MNIVHVVSLQGIGGVQKNFLDYFYSLDSNISKNHKVFIIGKKNKLLKNKNFYNLYSFRFFLLFLFYLRSKKYIIHFYNNFGSLKLYLLLKFFKCNNVIIHERGTSWNLNSKFSHRLLFLSNKIDKIVVNSYASKYLLINKFKLKKFISKIIVIHNGIIIKKNIENFQKINSNNNSFTIGYIGRLETPKSVHTIIDVAKIMISNNKTNRFKFLIAGDGKLKNFLKTYSSDLQNVNFLGYIKNNEDFFKSIDLLLVPSIREPFGNIILEAGIFRVPVIASYIDGIPEIIDNMKSSILIEPKKNLLNKVFTKNQIPKPEFIYNPISKKLDKPKELNPKEIYDQIINIYNNKKLSEKMTSNLYENVVSKFSMENYTTNINKVYEEINSK